MIEAARDYAQRKYYIQYFAFERKPNTDIAKDHYLPTCACLKKNKIV